MKNIIKNCLIVAFATLSAYSYGMAELWPEGVKSGGDGCYQVKEVMYLGVWVPACCSNIEDPEGYKCVTDDCHAKMTSSTTGISDLSKGSTFVKFRQGYTTWAIIDGKAYPNASGIDVETMRSYLPIARKLFLSNKGLEMFSVIHSDEITIVIQRPEMESDLNEIIVFPEPMPSGEEMVKTIHKIDDKQLILYPNPASKNFTGIYFENEIGISQVSILTQDGQIMSVSEFGEEGVLKAEIDIENLKPALYIVKITDRYGRVFIRELIKDK